MMKKIVSLLFVVLGFIAVSMAGDVTIQQGSGGGSLTIQSGSGSGIDLSGVSGVLKASAGTLSGSATTSDVPEGTNQYFTTARATSAISASGSLSYANGVVSYTAAASTFTRCTPVPALAAADDNYPMGSFYSTVTVTGVWCDCSGTCSNMATFTLEDGSGNAMTITGTNPTCTAIGTIPNFAAVTAGNVLNSRESLRFDVTNTPVPETDTYDVCVSYYNAP